MTTLMSKPDAIVHSDNDILDQVWDLIWDYDVIRSLDVNSFSIAVENGTILLTGHLSRPSNRKLIENIAYSVQGVVAVNNQLVVDDDLACRVSQALGRDERTRPLILPVGVSHGWVSLGGEVPTHELQLVAEEVAAQVATVRGVISLPKVNGQFGETERRTLQPRLQAKAYDHNAQQGVITQVVIQPRNRLVTHVVVRIDETRDDRFIFHERLVPVEVMEVANKESVFLKRDGPSLEAYSSFKPIEFPLAPLDWQPPYPYFPGTTRWPREQRKRENRE